MKSGTQLSQDQLEAIRNEGDNAAPTIIRFLLEHGLAMYSQNDYGYDVLVITSKGWLAYNIGKLP